MQQEGAHAERVPGVAGEWRRRRGAAAQTSALTDEGEAVLQQAEAMRRDGDHAGAPRLLAMELPLPMGLTTHDATQPPNRGAELCSGSVEVVLFQRDVCGLICARLVRDAMDVAALACVSREACDVVRPMLPRAIIVHHDYQRWLEVMWYAWQYMAKSERML